MTTTCPWCGRVNDDVKGAHGRPDHGDVSICFGCGGVGLFVIQPGAWTTVRKPTPTEQRELDADPFVQDVVAAVREELTPTDVSRRMGWKA